MLSPFAEGKITSLEDIGSRTALHLMSQNREVLVVCERQRSSLLAAHPPSLEEKLLVPVRGIEGMGVPEIARNRVAEFEPEIDDPFEVRVDRANEVHGMPFSVAALGRLWAVKVRPSIVVSPSAEAGTLSTKILG
jgi:hypothetical protein